VKSSSDQTKQERQVQKHKPCGEVIDVGEEHLDHGPAFLLQLCDHLAGQLRCHLAQHRRWHLTLHTEVGHPLMWVLVYLPLVLVVLGSSWGYGAGRRHQKLMIQSLSLSSRSISIGSPGIQQTVP
jgi:hypothetical protein